MNHTLVIVREAVANDAPAIEDLYRQLVDNPSVCVLPERITELALDPKTKLLVAELEGTVVGTVLISLCSDLMFQNQDFAVVENVVVSSLHRNLGIGALLMREVERLCRSEECSKIMLLSSASRLQAHQFFERVGFIGSSKKAFIKYRSQFSVDE
jgi:N-acetylglutamate synthase-like GNAT family acetyltransferase